MNFVSVYDLLTVDFLFLQQLGLFLAHITGADVCGSFFNSFLFCMYVQQLQFPVSLPE